MQAVFCFSLWMQASHWNWNNQTKNCESQVAPILSSLSVHEHFPCLKNMNVPMVDGSMPKEGLIKRLTKLIQSPCSDDEFNPGYCVCEAVTPVLRYCQLFGVSPISLNAATRKSTPHTKPVFPRLKFQNGNCGTQKSRVDDVSPKPDLDVCGSMVKASRCFVSSHWKSLPFLINLLMLFSFIGVTTWMIFRIRQVLQVYFDGTDLYTFGTQTLCLYGQCDLILINSLLQREKFCEIWKLLLNVLKNLSGGKKGDPCCGSACCAVPQVPVEIHRSPSSCEEYALAPTILQNNLGQHASNPDIWNFKNPLVHQQDHTEMAKSKLSRRLRFLQIFTFGAVSVTIFMSVCHTISFFHLVFKGCFDGSHQDINVEEVVGGVTGKPPCPFGSFFLFLQKLFYGMIDFVQQGAAILFGTLCIIIYIFFEEIEDQLEGLLRDESNTKAAGLSRQYLIENLRLTYEDLCRCCRLISQCFGLSVLAISISSVISITCALYSVALYSGAIEKEGTTKIAKYLVIWAFHGWFGCFCLTLILLPGQMVTNASEAPSQVIGRCAVSHLDCETKYQLSLFQHQSRHRVMLTGCNITNISLGFIAAAATNVTTYILVILQFRLGVEKQVGDQERELSNKSAFYY